MLLLLGDEDGVTGAGENGGALLRISAVLALGKAVCRTSKVIVYIHIVLLRATSADTDLSHIGSLRLELCWGWELRRSR